MKRIFGLLALLAAAMVLPAIAEAQTVPGTITIDYVLPTKNTDGSSIAATGPTSLVRAQIWVSNAPIPDSAINTLPTAEVTNVGASTTQPVQIAVGGKGYVRLRVCNLAGTCGNALTTEVSATVVSPIPGVPTSVTITVRFS